MKKLTEQIGHGLWHTLVTIVTQCRGFLIERKCQREVFEDDKHQKYSDGHIMDFIKQ